MVEPPLCPICRASVELDIPHPTFRMSGVFLSCTNSDCAWCLDYRENLPPLDVLHPPAYPRPQAVIAHDGAYWSIPWISAGAIIGLLFFFL